jgi:polysaccharide biosynthesis transport protein
LALRVVKELKLDQDPEFQPQSRWSWIAQRLGLARRGRPGADGAGDADEGVSGRLDRAADVLLARLEVETVPISYILSITVTSQDPVKAQRIARTLANDYLASQREAREEAVQRVANWLKGRVDDLQSRVLQTEAAIERLKSEHGIEDTASLNLSDQQIIGLNAQLVTVRAEVATKKAQLDEARHIIEVGGDIQAIPEFMSSSTITELRRQQETLSWRETQLRSQLGENHAAVIAVKAQLAEVNKQMSMEAGHILSNMQTAYDIALQQEQSLKASLQRLTGSASGTEFALKLQQMRRVADADRKLYESYLSQFNEISQRRMLQEVSARIINPAGLPGSPSSPRRMLFYVFGAILGLGGGVLLVVLLEHLRTGVKTGGELEESFGYPVVGVIPSLRVRRPHDAALDQVARAIVDTPLSQLSEAVRALRIGLELSSSEGLPKVMLITSSIPDEGKSTAAMLLAASNASSGHRTVLLDCDLRQQSASRALGGRQQPGLSELLRGTAELMEVITKEPATGIYMIPAGSVVPNPADLLMSQRMRDLITELRDEFDFIVIDASPLLPVIDALPLATITDKILLVVEWSRTPRDCVSEAFKILRPEARRIAGIVLTKVDTKQLAGYGYFGKYPHRYRYLGSYPDGI